MLFLELHRIVLERNGSHSFLVVEEASELVGPEERLFVAIESVVLDH